MQMLAVQQRLLCGRRLVEGIEAAASVDHPDLEQHAIIAVQTSRGILLQVKPALLDIAAIRPKDRLPGKCGRARERVDVDEQAVVDAVELDRLAARRVDHARMPDDGGSVAADLVEAEIGRASW